MINGDFLTGFGFPKGRFFGLLLNALKSSPYSKGGMSSIVNGFLIGKLPANVETVSGITAPSMEIIRIFSEFMEEKKREAVKMRAENLPYKVWNRENIEQGALDQMDNAMRLPCAVAGAVCADSHQGYALPIGGVLATDNCVIPEAVGVDISCSMRLTVFQEDFPTRNSLLKEAMRKSLKTQTVFGTGIDTPFRDDDDPLFDSEAWGIPALKKYNLKLLARKQIGTSGSGNHFVSFGSVNGKIALLSHSGSRGLGYKIAKIYDKVAVDGLKGGFKNFAWLDMDSENGKEYWRAMHLCGEFASRSHVMIHDRIIRNVGLTIADSYMTNHNFAWKEFHVINGKTVEVIVHRKGAVQSFSGQWGIIGGSMGTPSYLVKGKGNENSLCSCSHGSGRKMSRKAAKETFTKKQMNEFMINAGVELLAGGLDESPMAYKDVKTVMESQKDLVDIEGEFMPKIVMMSEDPDTEN